MPTPWTRRTYISVCGAASTLALPWLWRPSKQEVEHVIREQNTMAANDIIKLFYKLIGTQLPIIAKQKECPADLKEGICSLIFAAPRCSELPQLSWIWDLFEKKYGKYFVAAAVDLRTNAGVNTL